MLQCEENANSLQAEAWLKATDVARTFKQESSNQTARKRCIEVMKNRRMPAIFRSET